jgi:hypothetical protein
MKSTQENSKNTNYKKMPKLKYTQNKAKSDNFWKQKFMQVLEAMHDSELTWAKEYWHSYGISENEAKVIEKEFIRQKQWRSLRNK